MPAKSKRTNKNQPNRGRKANTRPRPKPKPGPEVDAMRWPKARQLALAAFVVILGSGIAYVVASQTPDTWESVSELEYRGNSFVETAAISAASRTEIEGVALQYDLTADDVEERFVVRQIPNSEVLELRYRDEDRARALDVLSSLTDVIIDRATNSGLETQIEIVQDELERVRTDRDARRSDVDAIDAETDTSTDASASAAVEEIAVLSGQVADLELRLVDLQLRRVEEAPVIVTAPYTTTEPVGPKPMQAAVLGAVAGFAVALALLLAATRQK